MVGGSAYARNQGAICTISGTPIRFLIGYHMSSELDKQVFEEMQIASDGNLESPAYIFNSGTSAYQISYQGLNSPGGGYNFKINISNPAANQVFVASYQKSSETSVITSMVYSNLSGVSVPKSANASIICDQTSPGE